MVGVYNIPGFGLTSMLRAEAKNPHCLNVTWTKAADPVTGYKIHCFPADSWKPEIVKEIVKEIEDVNKEVISGLRPEKVYRLGITSACSGSQSKWCSLNRKLNYVSL